VNPGFRTDRVLTLRLSPNFSRVNTPVQLQSLTESILRRVRSTTGVASAALASNFPFSIGGVASGPGSTSFEIEGKPVSRGELAPQVDPTVVGTDYFSTIRQPILLGRDFTDHDDANAPLVAIINQTMARHRWPTENPVGRRITFDQGQHWSTIVGVVGDVKEYGLDHEVKDEVYNAFQNGFVGNLVVRTAGDPAALVSAVRAALHDVDSQLAVDRIQTLERLQQESVASPRVTTILLGLFALLALIISASGIAAVMALSVTQRTNELGVRMALGASRESILMMVLRHGLVLALTGTVVGIIGAMAVTRLLATLLYGTSPTEISTFAGVSVVFLTVAALACLIPARAVTAIDPVIALRQD
jgi:predicted permease